MDWLVASLVNQAAAPIHDFAVHVDAAPLAAASSQSSARGKRRRDGSPAVTQSPRRHQRKVPPSPTSWASAPRTGAARGTPEVVYNAVLSGVHRFEARSYVYMARPSPTAAAAAAASASSSSSSSAATAACGCSAGKTVVCGEIDALLETKDGEALVRWRPLRQAVSAARGRKGGAGGGGECAEHCMQAPHDAMTAQPAAGSRRRRTRAKATEMRLCPTSHISSKFVLLSQQHLSLRRYGCSEDLRYYC